jgi:uncharacterized protein YggE
MKKAFLIAIALFFVNSICFSQESGNRIYGYSQNRRAPITNTGNLLVNGDFVIEASVLLNLKPDSYVAVFGVAQEAQNADESNAKVNARIEDFLKNLSGLQITKNDIYVDFIVQNKIYDYQIKGDVAEQFLSGFETKKTVAVKYRNGESLEKILSAAAKAQIFDLIKVDYIVSDFDSAREKLFEEAAKIIKQKEARYKNSFGIAIKPISLTAEKYDAFYPAERYENYQASESSEARAVDYRNVRTTLTSRKSTTFYYAPLDANKFDRIINPTSIEPTVQFTLYLQFQYRLI